MRPLREDFTGYRMSEFSLLPEEWQVVRLGSVVAEIITGDWGQKVEAYGFEKCLVLRGTDFSKAEQGDLSTAPVRFIKTTRLKKRMLTPGDLLVELSGGSKDQPTGRIMLVKSDLLKRARLPVVFTNFVKRLRLKDTVRPDYFRMYWGFLYNQNRTRIYEKRTTGIRNFRLKDFLENESIPLPPLPEQRAIAYVLRAVQEAREATERVIAALRDLKRSLMRHLFTYGPVPVDAADQVALQDTPIGPIPAHWRVVRLGEVVIDIQAGDWGQSEHKEGDCACYVIRGTDFPNAERGILIGVPTRYLKKKSLEKRMLRPGDLLVEMSGGSKNQPTGRLILIKQKLTNLDRPVLFSNFVKRVRVNTQLVMPEFVRLFWQLRYDQGVTRTYEKRTTGIRNFKLQDFLKNEFIPLPPLSGQREIARILQTVDRKIEAEEARKEALDDLFKTLLHHLMTAKIRVPRTMVERFASHEEG